MDPFLVKWGALGVGIVIMMFLLLHLLHDAYFIGSMIGLIPCGGAWWWASHQEGSSGG
jgi:hypothetical protein